MNIAYFSDQYWPSISGVSVDAFKKHLCLLGRRVIVFVPDYPGAVEYDQIEDAQDVHRFQSHTIAFNDENRLVCRSEKRKIFALLDHLQPEIIHVHTEFALGKIATSYKCIFTGYIERKKLQHFYRRAAIFVFAPKARESVLNIRKKEVLNMEQDTGRTHASISTLVAPPPLDAREMLNKVPEITIFFWIIKVLATTVGETAADFLNINLNLGLTGTTLIMGGLLITTLFFQFRLNRYVPGIYWLAVVMISVVGTLITDNLVDNFEVPLEVTTILFAIALATTFAVWYYNEKTLSIHSIFTSKREAFYWLAILFTFALGTAAGDLTAEGLSLGYWKSALVFGTMIALVTIAFYRFKLNAIGAFWVAYILTRPLGSSLGDFLAQPQDNGGLALGNIATSGFFLATILSLVTFLTLTKRDQIAE